jgi:5-methylcytosine-specific restriction endonuclease McrA
MSCNHQRTKSTWVDTDDWYETNSATGYWEYSTEYTTVDIDLHRYKCTQCGEVMYYSGRAREHYEEGKKFDWIKGLDK